MKKVTISEKTPRKKRKPAMQAGFRFLGRSCIEKVWQRFATRLVSNFVFREEVSRSL
ncbi:MAG TPA: hypothetical protein IAB66_03825 [Candidatus Caccousia avistercoris]|nr:hypothetical protein [Candidatus Caccousia avistercoris]